MDLSVKQAMAKWPNVPAVYGWLSLDERGRWHIHERGDAAEGSPGELITSPQIVAFICRNYAADDQGRWYFQNGPQRVYVRLDAAPYVLRVADTGLGLVTHTGQTVSSIKAWWLDEAGRLYAQTDLGLGLIDGRDLESVLAPLRVQPGNVPLLDALEDSEAQANKASWHVSHPSYPTPVPLHGDASGSALAADLGFVANPLPE
ncbi:DUF2946 family protein [Bordetella genomosp. 4]|uniref:DUF2946 family protein n=1 Tax=Bordetella genomosp. 4 TaxID=463044 RepID=UPI000B9E65F4|nr:DUF2946 family protein [Bordetella genomosp. 4]OZI52575.1 hypothetical protein CAL21_02800 [Bordetella genomosp. 4]